MQPKRSAPTIRPGAYTAPVTPLIPVDGPGWRAGPRLRPEAYTAPVSPLIPVDRVPPKPRAANDGRGLCLLLWVTGFILLASAHAGVPAVLWLILGWYAAVYVRA